jgi:hypothetical protein
MGERRRVWAACIVRVVKESETSYLASLSPQVTCRRAMKRPRGTFHLSSKDLAPIPGLPTFSSRAL